MGSLGLIWNRTTSTSKPKELKRLTQAGLPGFFYYQSSEFLPVLSDKI